MHTVNVYLAPFGLILRTEYPTLFGALRAALECSPAAGNGETLRVEYGSSRTATFRLTPKRRIRLNRRSS